MGDRVRAIVARVAIVAAFVTGYFGSWVGAAITGNATLIEVDRCYLHYSRLEEQLYRCEGYWNRPHLARGPVAGAHIDVSHAELVDPLSPGEFGYELSADSYDHTAFAVIRGDAAVVVPTLSLVLAPLALGATLACAVILIAPRLRRPVHRPA